MSQLKKSPSIHSTLCMSSLALFLLFKIVNHFSLTFVIGVYVVVGRVRLQSPQFLRSVCALSGTSESGNIRWQGKSIPGGALSVCLLWFLLSKQKETKEALFVPVTSFLQSFFVRFFQSHTLGRKQRQREREEIFLARYHRQRLIEGNE